MANTASSAKRARQTVRRTANNKRVLSGVKNQIKITRETIKAGKKDEAKTQVSKAASSVDKAAKGGQIHRNKANRIKSRLAKALAVASK